MSFSLCQYGKVLEIKNRNIALTRNINEMKALNMCKTKNLQSWNVTLTNGNGAIFSVAAIAIKKTHYSWPALGYEYGNSMN